MQVAEGLGKLAPHVPPSECSSQMLGAVESLAGDTHSQVGQRVGLLALAVRGFPGRRQAALSALSALSSVMAVRRGLVWVGNPLLRRLG